MTATYRWDEINTESTLELKNNDGEVDLEKMQVALMTHTS
jgi:hypothetical protein